MINNLLPAGLQQQSKLQQVSGFYALIDPFFVEPIGYELNVDVQVLEGLDDLKDLRENAWGKRKICTAQSPVSTVSTPQLPYIVILEDLEDEHLQNILEGAFESRQIKNRSVDENFSVLHPFAALIETSLPAELLMERLEAMWTYTGSGTQARYLRLGDMRVMQWLAYILGAPALARWLGPIDNWHILNAQAKWISYQGLQLLNNADEEALFSVNRLLEQEALLHAKVTLDSQQQLMLSLSEAVNRAMAKWQQHANNACLDFNNAYETVWGSVRNAHYQLPKAEPEKLAEHALAIILPQKPV